MRSEWPAPELRISDAEAYLCAFMRRPLRDGDPFAVQVDNLQDAEVDRLVERFRNLQPPLSRHLELSIAYVHHRGRKSGMPPVLQAGQSVRGCNCEGCIGPSAERSARVHTPPKRRQRVDTPCRPLDVEAARTIPIVEVAARLGLGEPTRVGKEYLVRCPLHDDTHPSLRMNPTRGVSFCHPCNEGGDGIELVQRALRCTFEEAVLTLTRRAA